MSLNFFCDARKFVYSTVVFLRIEDKSNVQVHLIQSKARIAPCGKKEATIARLKLLGAIIAARLPIEIVKQFQTDEVHFWTDSTTVLAWLKREDTWGLFVENRVQEIRKWTPVKAWRHLPGSMNPADYYQVELALLNNLAIRNGGRVPAGYIFPTRNGL
ncbi:uncharacterized protein [Parasteatoda tepidariorum]|uniref:uncharacterized protein n=1 Tax=Parasteatoda tepidariorum TaxID=114398 RepID=UPI00077FB33E|nr:uncharacterized protein LOC107436665 [Parasteatoda tepidariorum]